MAQTTKTVGERLNELFDEYKDKIAEALRGGMSTDDLIEIIEDITGDSIYTDIEEAFDGNIYDAIKFGQENPSFDVDADYFTSDGWGGLESWDDLEDIKDLDDLAGDMLENEDDGGDCNIEEIISEYREERERIAREEEEKDTINEIERKRQAERARTIKSLCMVALSKAIEADNKINCVTPSDVSEELARLGVALSELFDAVAEHGQFDEDDARREEITSQFIKEEV